MKSHHVSTILACNSVLLSLDMTQWYLYGRSSNLDLASDLPKLPAYTIVSQEKILRDSYWVGTIKNYFRGKGYGWFPNRWLCRLSHPVDRRLKPPASFLHSSNTIEALGKDIFPTHSNILSHPHLFWNYIFIWRVKKKLSRCAQRHTSRRICWAWCQHLVPWSL